MATLATLSHSEEREAEIVKSFLARRAGGDFGRSSVIRLVADMARARYLKEQPPVSHKYVAFLNACGIEAP